MPALAIGNCCLTLEPTSSRVIDCKKQSDTASCPSGTTPAGCGTDVACSAYSPLDPVADTSKIIGCCVIPYNTRRCALQISPGVCPEKTMLPVPDCDKEPSCNNVVAAASSPDTPAGTEKAKVKINIPSLSVDIPTLNLSAFSNVVQGTDDNGQDYLFLPFISVYLAAAYKLGVGIAGVLSVIMIMVGGFIWLVSAGDSGKIKQGKSMITNAVVGLLLTVGSYTALQVINPDLTNLKGLRVTLVKPIELEINDDYLPEVDSTSTGGAPPSGGSSNLPPSQYDSIFAKYAPCAGVDPQVLKAIATAESGLKADKINGSGYIGLFQTKAANCPSVVKDYCTDLTNPDNNTAAGAAMIKKSVTTIQSKCPDATPHDQMVMIYVAHNMGGGMLQYVTKQGCDVAAMRNATIDYYIKNPKTAKAYAPKYQAACLAQLGSTDDIAMAKCTGGPKFDYAVKTADKSGVSQVLASSSNRCPY